MNTVINRTDVIENLYTIYNYSHSNIIEETNFAKQLLKYGWVFVVENIGGKLLFAPSKFVGYKNNTANNYVINNTNKDADGRETNAALDKIYNIEKTNDFLLTEFEKQLTFLNINRSYDTEKTIRFFYFEENIKNEKFSTFFICPTHLGGLKPQAFNNCITNKIAAIGWDLPDYTNWSWDEVEKFIKEQGYKNEKDAIIAHRNLMQMKVGDIICATNNNHGLFGVGIISSTRKYKEGIYDTGKNDGTDTYEHYVDVVWVRTEFIKTSEIPNLKVEGSWVPYGTLSIKNSIPKYINDLIFKPTNNQIINIVNYQNNNMTNSLSTILYGPPGTGKTYNTINKALEIIGYETSNKTRIEIKEAFDKYVDEGQIVFTTFHQSMSYEDFIEGIKPETKDDKVLYKVKDGIFKTIANKAFSSFINTDANKENYTSPTFDQLHSEFLESIKHFEGKEEFIFKTIYNHDIRLVEINSSTIVVMFRWQDVKKSTPAIQRFAVTKDKLKLLFEGGINPHTVKSLKVEFAPYMQHNLSVFYAVYKKFYEFIESKTESKSIEEVEIIDDYSFEEIFEDWQLLNNEEKRTALETKKKYVLIIDEINRGNVSQIFGELITLIEDDKRINCKEQLLLKLPYSKKEFGVPSNLYILGTMNTADRSIEALDTALRRRFVFEEMMPIPELLSPERMVWQLWWDYAKINWDEEPYKTKAANLYKLLGIESDFDPNEELWQRMKKEGQNENQIAYFDRVEFTGIDLQHLLETINKRVEFLLSRDNLIGHSYFVSITSVAELKTVFQNKIIPLLQEYFFGDYGKIGLVLGSEFLEIMEDEDAEDIFADFEYDGIENFSEKKIYRFVDLDNFDDDEFMNKVNSIF